MFVIGTVARLAQVSVRTLRYYDEIGLLRPVWVDPATGYRRAEAGVRALRYSGEVGLPRPVGAAPATGYRWYDPDQLHRLHRILALRDLGVRLVDIGRLLDEDVAVADLRGILLLRR